MKHNQHKTRHSRTQYDVVKGNPMFGMNDSLIAINTITPKEEHEAYMPKYCKLNKRTR